MSALSNPPEGPPATTPMNFFNEDGPLTDPGHLEPAAIPAGSSSDRELFSELSRSRMFGFNPITKTPDLSGHWIEIFRIAFLDKDYKVAGEAFEAIHSFHPNMASFVEYELRRALDARRLTGQAVDLWRVLYDIDSNDGSVVLGYGQSLVALERLLDQKLLRCLQRQLIHQHRAVGAPAQAQISGLDTRAPRHENSAFGRVQ